MPDIQYYLLVNFLVAIGIGFLIGLERERHQEEDIFAGIRTFSILAVFGAVITEFFPDLIVFAFLAVTCLVLLAYFMKVTRKQDIGMTTSITTLLVFVLGAMCSYSHDTMIIAVMLGIVAAILLAVKDPLHAFANDVEPDEMEAILKFLVISLVVLPLLPDRSMDVLYGLNPRFVWMMVIFVSGIGFAAYVLTKWLGPRAGIGLTGVLGGLLSSTATTVEMSERTKLEERLAPISSLAIVIACLAMFPRMLLEIMVVFPGLLNMVLIPVSVMVVAGLIPSILLFTTTSDTDAPDADLDNPFRLKPALLFGAFFAVILFLSKYSLNNYGSMGILLTSALSGIADVDAITLSVGRLMQKEELSSEIARNAVIIAACVNTAMKIGITWAIGTYSLAVRVTSALGLSIIAGVGFLFI